VGGRAAAASFIARLTTGLRTAMVLTGSRDLGALGRAPVVLGSRLQQWVNAGGGA
jgi:isopentenyl diphosphate isomerase/L-lactate dehydrogenase-like FMN-dependent dehydrogenase